MLYREWTIKIFSTYHGYSAQFTSPMGQEFNTCDCFSTERQAISYAQSRINGLIEWEKSRQKALAGSKS